MGGQHWLQWYDSTGDSIEQSAEDRTQDNIEDNTENSTDQYWDITETLLRRNRDVTET